MTEDFEDEEYYYACLEMAFKLTEKGEIIAKIVIEQIFYLSISFISMPQYEILEHTADLFIKAYGKNIGECFENIAYAMFDNIVNAEKVENIGELEIKLSAEDKERLLVKFLSELLFIFETKKLVFSKFKVKLNGNELSARVFGEKFEFKKHGIKKEIKAITYHLLEINEKEEFVKVLFDI